MIEWLGLIGQWLLIIFAVVTVLYNTRVTHVTLKNDVKHLDEKVDCLQDKVDRLVFHLLGSKE